MAGMTDQSLVNNILTNLFKSSGTVTWNASGSGGVSMTITPPFHLRLYTVTGSETGSGTEMATGQGYTSGSVVSNSLGTTFAGTVSGGSFSNANAVSWSATGTWANPIVAIEIWDQAGTPVRYLWGTLGTAITGVVNGDTVQFAASSVTCNASTWLCVSLC